MSYTLIVPYCGLFVTVVFCSLTASAARLPQATLLEGAVGMARRRDLFG